MLSEEETRQRAAFYFCAGYQLKMLFRNDLLHPGDYLTVLKRSSLNLADDELVRTKIEESIRSGADDGGLIALITLFEGFVFALCEVLEIEGDTIGTMISPEFLQKLADEMSGALSDE